MGDCLDVMRALPDGCVDMILCDLPYGMTQNKWDAIIPFEPLWAEYWRICKSNAAVVLAASQPFTSALVMSQVAQFRYSWSWIKQRVTGHLNAKKQPLRNVEDICVFYNRQPVYNPQFENGEPYSARSKGGGRKFVGTSTNYGSHDHITNDNDGVRYPRQSLFIDAIDPKLVIHPTQKPIALFEYLIKTYTDPGMIVLDNCIGSGTTAVAAIQSGRRWIGIEREPSYWLNACFRIRDAEWSLSK